MSVCIRVTGAPSCSCVAHCIRRVLFCVETESVDAVEITLRLCRGTHDGPAFARHRSRPIT